ncbi:hypothetical protein [Smaragdicoccus niigatensis]|uniref:hypothetical protein n=1 Tax=Smaragdicoccus niigatensis TaxID=359359 RepID=UPI00039C34CA|nr:hypothetical protein [Smaragdicoccus niigatensis]
MPVKTSRTVLLGSAAAVALGVATTAGMAFTGPSFDLPWASGTSCSIPDLHGAVVDVTVTDMGSMMGGRGSMMGGYGNSRFQGPMAIYTSQRSVPAGQVSLRVRNNGRFLHEVIVMPLAGDARVGQRAIGATGEVDETGSLGEASNTCGSGEGDGIAPGASGWVTLNLPAGRYELLCNIEGHYGSGTFTELDVT